MLLCSHAWENRSVIPGEESKMNGKAGFGFLRSMPSTSEPSELKSWRDRLLDTVIFFAVFVLPLSMLATFPVYIEEKLFGLIAIDLGLYLFVLFHFFLKGRYKGRSYICIALVYALAISFHVALGPHYARPAWLIMAAVVCSILFGTRAAVLATVFNIVILLSLYWLMRAHSGSWADVYRHPFWHWIMYMVNFSCITLACCLPVGFLLKKLDISLKHEREAHGNLLSETEKLEEAYGALQKETEERKSAEKALRQSEKSFRNLVENLNEGIYSLDRDGVLTYVNPAIERIFGYPEKEIIGRSFNEFVHEEDLEGQKGRFKRLLTEPAASDEYRVITKQGDIRWIRSSTHPVFNQGRLEFLEGVLFDITESKQAEEEILDAKQRYQSLFNSKTTFVFVMDDRGNLVDANDFALELFEYSRDELSDLNYLQLIHEDQRPDPIERVLKEINEKGAQSESLEVKLKSKTGKTIYLETGVTTVLGKNEIIGVARDITAQKKAEAALYESERKYRSVIENIQDVFYRSDDQGRLLMGSHSGAEMFGFDSIGEMIGIPLDNFWPDPKERQMLLDRIRKDGSVRDFEAVLQKKDGSTFNASFTTQFYYDDHGQLRGTEGFIRDITDKKRAERERQMLEDQLLQAQKMEAIGTLAGGIAHDFNNSLQSILGYTQILLMDAQEDEPALDKLKKIKAVVLRASELAQQILAFSRKIESKLRPVDLNQEVKQVEKILIRTIPKMINIELNLDQRLNIVNADAAQIEQVMMNLGVNAMDAMPDGGQLTIETENVFLDEEYCRTHLEAVPGEYVMLSISDDGIGMDKETLEHLFEPFYTTKDAGRGTGLGLAMVYGIVKNHGGHIMCYSEPGEGTIFRIYFPVVEEVHENRIKKQKKVKIKGGTETILVVDDEDSIREAVDATLSKFGYKVLSAANGKEALEIYQQEKDSISLVVLDLIMPGMGGKKCLKEILKIDPSQRVIIASGYSVSDAVNDVLEIGAKGYLQKPYDLAPMLNFIREILDKK
jgi:PAS domain S-box-containing protein